MNKNVFVLGLMATTILTTFSCKPDDICEDTDRVNWYDDADGDGFGNPLSIIIDCDQPEGYVSNNTDCDDTDELVNPDATEIADNDIDDDCDGEIDE